MPTITAIVTAYRRPQNIEPLVAAIRRQSVPPTAIWAWANDPNENMKAVLAKAKLDRVVICSDNARFHGRFALALLARTEYVAIFDDDSIPGEQWFANCLKTMDATPGILGAAGVVLHERGYAKRTMHGWQRPSDTPVEVDLVCQAWFLRTEWVKYLFSCPPVIGTNGEDIELAARAWRLAGIRSFCPPHPESHKSLWGSTRGMELGLDDVAASFRVEHLAERRQIVEAEIAAGWKPLFMREEDGNCKMQVAKCKLQIEEQRILGPATSEAESNSTALTPALSRREREEEIENYVHSVAECGPRWVTEYSYPTGDSGQPTAPARVSLKYIDAAPNCHSARPHPGPLPEGEGEWCVDCLEEIESLGEHSTAGAAVPQFDKIDLGPALEHVRDPLAFLRRARRLLKKGGELTASVHNVRRQEVVERLIYGRWEEGHNDRGKERRSDGERSVGNPPSADGVPSALPLRFFTRREIEKLVYRTGFHLSDISLSRSGTARSPFPTEEESQVERYQLVATAVDRAPYGLTSIVILTHNQLAYTRACLDSIRFLTDEPYELIVVDNGSTDGTVEYLRSCPDVKLIENADNRGFPEAANQGIKASSGAQVLLLNNDVLVTTGWLRRMLETLEGGEIANCKLQIANCKLEDDRSNRKSKIENPKSRVGLVGPLTNCASGYQEIPVSYADTTCLDGFAWEHAKQHGGEIQEVDRLIGFCLLIRREVIDEIGLLDERFGIGNYEDDDYCRRARNAGWRLVVARDTFIHHFGHKTFDGAGVDLNALLIRNRQVYDEKWAGKGSGEGGEIAKCPEMCRRQPGQIANCKLADDRSNPKSKIENPKSPTSLIISLCMIVRNNADTIRPCLESIKPWVDEIIVVDTGSTDETPQICRELGAQVYHFPWPDSFSVARNESLRHARGDWIFWMDSDDVIDPVNGRKLRELACRQHGANVLGYVMQVHCPGSGLDGMHDVTVVDHLKLFRNRPALRFEGRIHEQVLDAINRIQGDIVFTDIFVVHAGADHSTEGRKRKLKRDIKLLRLDYRERPNHTFVHFNLGMTYADAKKHRKAIKSLSRSLELAQPHESHVRKIYALMVSSHRELGEKVQARQACAEGLKLYPKDPELLFRHAMLMHEDSLLRAAEQGYLAALANNDDLHFSSMDRGIVGFKARHNLAAVYTDMGALHKAEAEWRRIVEEVPTYRDGWRGLVENLLLQGKSHEAATAVETLVAADPRLRGTGLTLAARVAEAAGRPEDALATLRQARRECPDDLAPFDDLCRHLFYHGDLHELEEALRELVRRQPDNAAAHQNLGTMLLRAERYQEAAEAFRASLRQRPDSAVTQLSLGYALFNDGRRVEASAAFEHCIQLATEPRLAAEAQRQLAALAA